MLYLIDSKCKLCQMETKYCRMMQSSLRNADEIQLTWVNTSKKATQTILVWTERKLI